MVEAEGGYAWQPTGAPLEVTKDDNWTHFDNSVNAVSFGFVATAILISMFLVMAIFERFLRPPPPALSPSGGLRGGDIESQTGFNGKLGHSSPKIPVYPHGVSVLMPGDSIPTYIAHLAPVPCSTDSWPDNQNLMVDPPAVDSNTSTNSVTENQTQEAPRNNEPWS